MRFNAVMYLLLVCGGVFSGGCSKPSNLVLHAPIKYYRFSGGRQIGESASVPTDSAACKSIQAWLKKQRPWAHDVKSYAPREVLDSELVRLNYLEEAVVISVRESASQNWSVFSCPADAELMAAFAELRQQFAPSETRVANE